MVILKFYRALDKVWPTGHSLQAEPRARSIPASTPPVQRFLLYIYHHVERYGNKEFVFYYKSLLDE